MSTCRLLIGDVRKTLSQVEDESVQTCVTSPPYWGLRDYGHDGQLGLEETPEEYVARMVGVFREVRRVLRDDGTLWLNLGDSYAASGVSGLDVQTETSTTGKANPRAKVKKVVPIGLKPKDLVGIPWRVAFALQADGWWLRSAIVWAKPNPMPESVRDRPTSSYEFVFLLAKSERYYYDADAIAEPLSESTVRIHSSPNVRPDGTGREWKWHTVSDGGHSGAVNGPDSSWMQAGTRNARNVWTITTKPFSGCHFAVFPPELAEKCIMAGTSEKGCCPECGAPWERVVERGDDPNAIPLHDRPVVANVDPGNAPKKPGSFGNGRPTTVTGWSPTCEHDAEPVPCTVLDPFAGSGTTGMVATGHGRRAILCELNPEYADLIRHRVGPMFMEAA